MHFAEFLLSRAAQGGVNQHDCGGHYFRCYSVWPLLHAGAFEHSETSLVHRLVASFVTHLPVSEGAASPSHFNFFGHHRLFCFRVRAGAHDGFMYAALFPRLIFVTIVQVLHTASWRDAIQGQLLLPRVSVTRLSF